MSDARTPAAVTSLLSAISDVGRDPNRGGYTRPVFSTAELDLRAWFVSEAVARGLDVETDRNGIIWAWWDHPSGDRRGALVTGSHLDSVPGGGSFDGPLGIASALVAVDLLRARGVRPPTAIAIAVFPEEEGSRFGVACLGSRLLTGAIDVDRARSLTDADGNTFAEVSAANGIDPRHLGADRERLDGLGGFIELHVEQGRGLIDLGQAVAIGSSILGHGRWRLSFVGQGNHAGTTLMSDRRDPMVAAAALILGIRDAAEAVRDGRATVGRIQPVPGGTNVIASRVDLWLDVRHPDNEVTAEIVAAISERGEEIAREQGGGFRIVEESLSPTVAFDQRLQRHLSTVLPQAPILSTGAGHDAGVLTAHVPSAMLFVRNPTGVSHSPEEHAEAADVEYGAEALAAVLARGLPG